MDDDQFESFVLYASMYFSDPDNYVGITAAEALARGYFVRDQVRSDPDALVASLIEKSPFHQRYGDPDGSRAKRLKDSLRDRFADDPDEFLGSLIEKIRERQVGVGCAQSNCTRADPKG